ncbi:6-phosphofructokinase [Umbelopsis sp. PMI_123]|nr:6-phosphofructokinase [Umbelopsis sp. PMI_123]
MSGLSHLLLTTADRKLYESTLDFYQALGFKPHTRTDSQIYLKLTATVPAQDLTIKLKLVDDGTVNNSEKSAATIVIASDNLENVAAVIKERQLDFMKEKESYGGFVIKTKDPLGNALEFTDEDFRVKLSSDPSLPVDASNKRKIAVLTSGGDSAGMNAAVRAVVRAGIARGCDVFAVYEGYQGLVDGGSLIKKMSWNDVRGFLEVGGTSIGTARCMAFKQRPGRLQAAENLVTRGIDSIVVCGGDGSLTGADVFRSEWPGLLDELLTAKRITEEQYQSHRYLTIVGLVGSIDNDMSSTDITIGAYTSLARICESVDSIASTAISHSRAFVVEVMGRHCGWLALMAAISTGADFVFLPEKPPSDDDWETAMCDRLTRRRALGKRNTLVIVAEGALDKNLNPIKPDQIKEILSNRMGLDTRVTTLGHVQRGGSPVAYDRYLATVQGVEAVEAVLRATPETPSPMIGMSQNKITWRPLMKAVELTHAVATAIGNKDFEQATSLRDSEFRLDYEAYKASTVVDDPRMKVQSHQKLRVGIIHVGAPAGGMNAATRTAVLYCLNRGHTPVGIYNGFPGLFQGAVQELDWLTVDQWSSRGGSELGTNRSQPDADFGMTAHSLQQYKIDALLIVGGFEAFTALVQLESNRDKYPMFRIPMVHLPATISNNVPGTDFSLGSDTGLNAIVNACDALVQSASASRRRVFVVEVQGGRTGYLAVMAGLATGATTVYIPEEGISLDRLQRDVKDLVRLYKEDDPNHSEGRIILRNEKVSKTYSTDVISEIIKTEGNELFDSRTAVLGHTQQGGTPSPMDRIRASRLAVKCIQFIEQQAFPALDAAHAKGATRPVDLVNTPESACVIGIVGTNVLFSPVKSLLDETDMKERKSNKAWWMPMTGLIHLLSIQDSKESASMVLDSLERDVDL